MNYSFVDKDNAVTWSTGIMSQSRFHSRFVAGRVEITELKTGNFLMLHGVTQEEATILFHNMLCDMDVAG